MGWSIGYDADWERDIGYGVPAYCDHPDCKEEIDRGLGYVCGGEPYGGDDGCGLFFCGKHLFIGEEHPELCSRCCPEREEPFKPKSDHPDWIKHKLTHDSWGPWRKENSKEVVKLKANA